MNLMAVLDPDAGNADVAFLIAFLGMFACGLAMIVVTPKPRTIAAILVGLAWMFASLIPLGYLYLTP